MRYSFTYCSYSRHLAHRILRQEADPCGFCCNGCARSELDDNDRNISDHLRVRGDAKNVHTQGMSLFYGSMFASHIFPQETDILGVCLTALFALPSVRAILPGAPDFGAIIGKFRITFDGKNTNYE
jgi:hypothetical protein